MFSEEVVRRAAEDVRSVEGGPKEPKGAKSKPVALAGDLAPMEAQERPIKRASKRSLGQRLREWISGGRGGPR